MGLAQRSGARIFEGRPGNLDLEWLVPSIAAGDEPAVARFYDATSGLLFGLLLLILGDTMTAEKSCRRSTLKLDSTLPASTEITKTC